MPFILIDGFDHESALADLITKWSGAGHSAFSIDTTEHAFNGAALKNGNVNGNVGLYKSFPSALGRVIVGCAIKPENLFFEFCAPAVPAGFLNDILFLGYDGGNGRFELALAGNYASPIAFTPNGSVPAGVWCYVEFDCVFSTTVGSVKINVNGVNVLNQTGIAMNSATCQSFNIGNNTNNADWVDDLYILNPASESAPYNNPLGACRVQTLYPAADSAVQWTPLSGTNFSNVDATQFNGGSSYNHASTLNDTDDFTVNGLYSNPATIFGVGVTGAFENDTNTDTATIAVRFNGTSASGVVTPSNASYAYNQAITEIASWANPTCGYELTALSAGNARASQLVAEVLTSQATTGGGTATGSRRSGFKYWWREIQRLIGKVRPGIIPFPALAQGF
jgi:hypothetical protein